MSRYDLQPEQFYFLQYHDLEEIVEDFFEMEPRTFNFPAEVEASNDTAYVYHGIGSYEISKNAEDDVYHWMKRDQIYGYFPAHDALSIMARADYIPKGNYVVNVSW